MSATLMRSLESISLHIDQRFEIVVVDDGSSDSSVDLLQSLVSTHGIRLIPLQRDNRRKLGETRNVSIRAARGKYCILHIDTDDVWDDLFIPFTNMYHEIERRLNVSNFMLSGLQMQMATKKLLIENPYTNVYYVEDRVLWNQLSVSGSLLSIDHKIMRTRIPLSSSSSRITKIFKSQFAGMSCAFSTCSSALTTTRAYINSALSPSSDLSVPLRLLRLILLPAAFFKGFILNRFPLTNNLSISYRDVTRLDVGLLETLTLKKFGIYNLSPEQRKVFFLPPTND